MNNIALLDLSGQFSKIRKMLNIEERQQGDTTILNLEGNIIMGGGSKQLGDETSRLIEMGNANILLNFARVKYLDSSGVGELLSLLEKINQAGGTLRLSNMPPKVEEVLTLSSVLPMFDIYDDENAALDA